MKTKNIILTFIIGLITFLVSVNSVKSIIPISSCQNLDIPGETYVLTNDLNVTAIPYCFNVTAANITFDINGKTIKINNYDYTGTYHLFSRTYYFPSGTSTFLIKNGNITFLNVYYPQYTKQYLLYYRPMDKTYYFIDNVTVTNLVENGLGFYVIGSTEDNAEPNSRIIISNSKFVNSLLIPYATNTNQTPFIISNSYFSQKFVGNYPGFTAHSFYSSFQYNIFKNMSESEYKYFLINPNKNYYESFVSICNNYSGCICNYPYVMNSGVDNNPIINECYLTQNPYSKYNTDTNFKLNCEYYNPCNFTNNQQNPVCSDGSFYCASDNQYLVCVGGNWWNFGASDCLSNSYYANGVCNCNNGYTCNCPYNQICNGSNACIYGSCTINYNMYNCPQWSECFNDNTQYCIMCPEIIKTCVYQQGSSTGSGVVYNYTCSTDDKFFCAIDKAISNLGINTFASKFLLSIILILVVISFFASKSLHPIVYGIVSMLLIGFFSFIGWLPVWLPIVVIVILLFILIFFRRGGDGG